jgi:hypothetical protein
MGNTSLTVSSKANMGFELLLEGTVSQSTLIKHRVALVDDVSALVTKPRSLAPPCTSQEPRTMSFYGAEGAGYTVFFRGGSRRAISPLKSAARCGTAASHPGTAYQASLFSLPALDPAAAHRYDQEARPAAWPA